MKPQVALEHIRNALKGHYDARETSNIAEAYLMDSLNLSRVALREAKTLALEEEKFNTDVAKLAAGVPLQYVTGVAWFYDLKLNVGPGVLIPRPETEELLLLARQKPLPTDAHILDACTGSGCLALGLQAHFPKAQVWGIDLFDDTLYYAKENAAQLGLSARFLKADLLADKLPEALPKIFDRIVSNPPYVLPQEKKTMAEHVLQHEPEAALFVPSENPALFYEALNRHAQTHLRSGGELWAELGPPIAEDVWKAFKSDFWAEKHLLKDLQGRTRFLFAKAA